MCPSYLPASVRQQTISTVGRVLRSDFVSMIRPKIQVESYPKSSSGIPRAAVTGDDVLNFLVLLDNLDVASVYTYHLISTFINASSVIIREDRNPRMGAGSDSAVPLEELFPLQTEPTIVRDALTGIEAAFEGKVGELANDGIMVFNRVVKPKLRPPLAEELREVEYLISLESEKNAYSHSDPGY